MSKIKSSLFSWLPLKSWSLKCGILMFGIVSFSLSVQAQDAPNVSPVLQKMLSNLPIAGIKEELQGMVSDLGKTSCGGNLSGCYMTQSGPLQLYFFTRGSSQQTLLLVVDKSVAMPRLLGEKVQKVMGETSLRSPIISISTTDFQLDQIKMPAALRKVVRDQYFNVNTLSFSSGVQLAARANLGGPIKLTMEAFGVKANEVMLRAAVVMPIPSDLSSMAGAGAAAMSQGNTMAQTAKDATKPEAFVEFQFAPNARLPLVLPPMSLTDATFFINNSLTFGYKGNAIFRGAEDKKIIIQFQTPLSPEGVADLLDFSFRMATPANFTMEDAAYMMVAMASKDKRLLKYGGFINSIDKFKDPLLDMLTPLSVVQFRNPNPPPEYRFGDSSKPFPNDNKYFNYVLLGPLADGGPFLSAGGEVNILGQTMGWMQASAGLSGLRGDVGQALTLKLGPLGRVTFSMQATTAINADKQQVGLMGNFSGQKVEVSLNGDKIKVEVSASCVNPFEISTQVTFNPSTKLEDVFNGAAAINVDPSKIQGCIGKELEAAYNKIAGEFSDLEGYTAREATAALNKLGNAAEQEFNQTKEQARKAAESSINAATNAWTGGTNALISAGTNAVISVVGGSTSKAQDTSHAHFDRSTFDWDYYYDNFDIDAYNKMQNRINKAIKNPFKKDKKSEKKPKEKSDIDLVAHWDTTGYPNGWRGSLEFDSQFYAKNYQDYLMFGSDARAILLHWIIYGIEEGRMGSADFDVKSYVARYPDLQKAFGVYGYKAALGHWLSGGKTKERRDGRPFATALLKIGRKNSTSWDDYRYCQGQPVTGFAVRSGRLLDGLAFLYANGNWGPPHGSLGSPPYTAEVRFRAGEYVVRVDYRAGDEVDSILFHTNTGRKFGPYGGNGGSPGTYNVIPGQKLGCMQGRSGSRTDQLTFSSTVPAQ